MFSYCDKTRSTFLLATISLEISKSTSVLYFKGFDMLHQSIRICCFLCCFMSYYDMPSYLAFVTRQNENLKKEQDINHWSSRTSLQEAEFWDHSTFNMRFHTRDNAHNNCVSWAREKFKTSWWHMLHSLKMNCKTKTFPPLLLYHITT